MRVLVVLNQAAGTLAASQTGDEPTPAVIVCNNEHEVTDLTTPLTYRVRRGGLKVIMPGDMQDPEG